MSRTASTNACKLCAPLGACVAYRGIAGTLPLIHGSQGCATYIRRYLISHFNEPMDIASSSIGEFGTVFGGESNLNTALRNVTQRYHPELIGVSTSCLTETIGEDTGAYLTRYRKALDPADTSAPAFAQASTPSYAGTHIEGFHAAIRAVVDQLTEVQDPLAYALPQDSAERATALLPGFVSTADLRYLKQVMADFGIPYTLLPDYSDTLDAPALLDVPAIPTGGTSLISIRELGQAAAVIEFGRTIAGGDTAGSLLNSRFGVPLHALGMPIGVRETDRFFEVLEAISGSPTPTQHTMERGRLIDSYVDGHKYVFEKRAVVYGEEDLVIGLAAFLAEIGVVPVLCATGGHSGKLKARLTEALDGVGCETEQIEIRDNVDFDEIGDLTESLRPDFILGSSKGYSIARRLGIPLVRVGFPIHDRLGGQRILHLGYRGAQQLFDMVVNTLLTVKQDRSDVGYSYM